MHPLIIAGLVAGAFFLGRQAGRDRSAPLAPRPSPDAPKPLPEGTTGDYSEAWSGLPYGIEVYPPGAPTDFPPPAVDGLIAAPGCTVIAVSDGWWDQVAEYVQVLLAENAEDARSLHSKVTSKYLPNCVGKKTLALDLLQAELMERIEGFLGPQQEDPGNGYWQLFPDVQISLGPGAQIHKRNKPGVGLHTVVVEPKSIYNPALGHKTYTNYWRVWAPGSVTEGTHILEGYDPSMIGAQQAAFTAIDEYAVKNPGGQFVRRSVRRTALGRFPRRRKWGRRF
jgi:hypothetical protein